MIHPGDHGAIVGFLDGVAEKRMVRLIGYQRKLVGLPNAVEHALILAQRRLGGEGE